MGYIPAGALNNLKQYKYSVFDARYKTAYLQPFIFPPAMKSSVGNKWTTKSLFSQYVLQPYWNYMIRFVPMWIAPNLITLIG